MLAVVWTRCRAGGTGTQRLRACDLCASTLRRSPKKMAPTASRTGVALIALLAALCVAAIIAPGAALFCNTLGIQAYYYNNLVRTAARACADRAASPLTRRIG